jgi:hypothetical protein
VSYFSTKSTFGKICFSLTRRHTHTNRTTYSVEIRPSETRPVVRKSCVNCNLRSPLWDYMVKSGFLTSGEVCSFHIGIYALLLHKCITPLKPEDRFKAVFRRTAPTWKTWQPGHNNINSVVCPRRPRTCLRTLCTRPLSSACVCFLIEALQARSSLLCDVSRSDLPFNELYVS